MLFGCCHPALRVEARLALMLRAVVGLTTPQIARAFLVPEATMAQRLVRAKKKIGAVGIAFEIPVGRERSSPARRGADGDLPHLQRRLPLPCGRRRWPMTRSGWPSCWLGRFRGSGGLGVAGSADDLSARAGTRFDGEGRLVLLADQDRTAWNAVGLARAERYLVRSAELRRPGRFQLQAAIAACHADAARWADTDWLQILTLYDLLLTHDPSPVVRLNHAIALSHVSGPAPALAELSEIAERLGDYHLLHATRAQLLTELGDLDGARAANLRALELTDNPAEQDLLRTRVARFDG